MKTSADIFRNRFEIEFEKHYPKKRLLAVQLNGFTHSVFYDNGKASDDIKIDRYSYYMPEGEWSIGAMKMFHNVPHHTFQFEPVEIVYVNKDER
jgi:hypothetical protein